MLFRFLRTLLGPLLHLWCVLQYLFSRFHFLELVVNRKPKSRWTGSNYINLSNLCTLRPKALFRWGPWSDVIRSEPFFVLRSPNFYWLCNDLLSVAYRRFGISLILMDVSQFNLNANYRNFPFHAIFRTGSDDLATGSDDLLGSLGFLWWLNSF